MFDTHLHCEFSTDGKMSFPEAQAAARRLGIGIILTEHWDYDFPGHADWFLFDRDEYFRRNSPYRRPTQGTDAAANAGTTGSGGQDAATPVLLGLELGMQPHLAEKEEQVPVGYPFDYVIGSIHMLNRQDLYQPETYDGLTRDEALRQYLEQSIASVTNHDNFDSLGHIDYICRYWPYAEKNFRPGEVAPLWDRLFRLLIEKDKALEINTRRLDDPAAVRSLLPLYRRYAALGGRYCTIGSDAHEAAHVGRRLTAAADIAAAAGLDIVYYEARQRHPDTL